MIELIGGEVNIMKMKKYEVTDMKEALRLIKEELGPDAVILSTKKVMKNNNFGLFAKPLLEVTAAVDHKTVTKSVAPKKNDTDNEADNAYATYQPSYVPKNNISPHRPSVAKRVNVVEAAPPPKVYDEEEEFANVYRKEYVELAPPQAVTRNNNVAYQPVNKQQQENNTQDLMKAMSSLGLDKIADLVNDIGDIKRQLSDIKTQKVDSNMVVDLVPKLKDYYSIIRKNGVDDVVAYRFLKNFERSMSDNLSNIQIKNAIQEKLSELIIAEPSYHDILKKRIIALAGPTGVGKTTTVAKIAASLTLKYRAKVCLITIDNFRIGAVEQLKTYAEIVSIPLYVATSPDELKRIIKDVRQEYDFILLDSMGRSQFDTSQIESINSFLSVDDKISVALVLSLASNHAELFDTFERYSALNPEYVIFTKLDETKYFGALINLSVKKRVPFLLLTTGQNVPDDMEAPDGKKIAKKVLQEIPTIWSEK